MPTLFNKAMVYLGLVDESAIEEEVEARAAAASAPTQAAVRSTAPAGRTRVAVVEGRRVEPSAGVVRSYRGDHADDLGNVRQMRPVPQADIIVMEEFGDAKIIADRVRTGVPVVMDLRQTDPDLVRRIIDFSSGLIYALDGRMTKTAEGVVLVLPIDTHLTGEEERRLAGLGLYNR